MSLSFDQLRAANVARLPIFKNAQGETAHAAPDGSDWKLSAWSNAVCGELGEAANIIKKMERGDFRGAHFETARHKLALELADVATYLDLLAFRAGIDLGAAIRIKFNEVSERVGCNIRLGNQAATDLEEFAWGIIANAGGGDWSKESEDWQAAAAKFRDQYHQKLKG